MADSDIEIQTNVPSVSTPLFVKIRKLIIQRDGITSTLTFCFVLIIGMILGKTEKAGYLTLSPIGLMNYHHVWTLLTTSFVETNLLIGLFHTAYLFSCGVLLEPAEPLFFVSYTIIISIASALFTVNTQLLSYYGTYQDAYFTHPVIGAAGIAAGHGVLIAYSIPDKTIIPKVGIPCRYIPFLWAVVSLVLTQLQVLVRRTHFWFSIAGIYSGWVYIRFYKLDSTGCRGDREFTFDVLFPRFLRPFITLLTSTALGVLNFVGLCREKKRVIPLENAFKPTAEEPLLLDENIDPELKEKRANAITQIEERVLQALN